MKRLFSYITMLLLAAPIWAQSVTPCENAPEVTQAFEGIEVPMPLTTWFSAWTYDLPLNICFTPSTPTHVPPSLLLDFRCGNGAYPTEELENFFNPPQQGGVSVDLGFPRSYTFTQSSDGSYCFAIPETYRYMMFRAGLTEDVKAYVCVTFPVAGTVSMAPTEEFRQCVGDGEDDWVTLGDTLTFDANGSETYVCPIALWRNDSIRFVWTGDEDVDLTFHYTCDVDGDYLGNTMVSDYYTIPAHGEVRLSQEEVHELYDAYSVLKQMVELPIGTTEGLYFAFLSRSCAGKLVIERIPSKDEEPEPEPEPEPETCKETEYKAQVTVEQYCDTLLPYKWQVYEGREVMIAEAGTHYDTISSYLSDGTTRCDSVIYTLSLDTIHCERPAPEPPTGGEEEGDGEGDGDEGEEGETGGSGEGGSTGGGSETGGGETGGNQNTPNPPTPGPGFPEPNYPTGSVIYRGAQTISAVCVANAGNVTGAADGIVEVRVTKAQELRLMQGSAELERWMQQPGEVHRLTLREGVTYTLRGLETLYLRR